MVERMTDEAFMFLSQQGYFDRQDVRRVFAEARRARREETQQQDRIHALEVQQAELIRQGKEKDVTIKALADALALLWELAPEDGAHQQVAEQVEAALRLAGRLP